jgi:hypothetical protein
MSPVRSILALPSPEIISQAQVQLTRQVAKEMKQIKALIFAGKVRDSSSSPATLY